MTNPYYKSETVRDRYFDVAYWDADWQEWTPLGNNHTWEQAVQHFTTRNGGRTPTGQYKILLVESEVKYSDMTGLLW